MKLHLDTIAGPASGLNAITGHGEGFVAVNGNKRANPIIVLPDKLIDPWVLAAASASATSLGIDDFAELLALKPELVVFGSGPTFSFPARALMAAFAQARIGFEVMDTPAACRTYNVLMGEGRRVAAALLVG
jgi:uncharacterized protein